jgi:transglutaminase-like putative cysteine protease
MLLRNCAQNVRAGNAPHFREAGIWPAGWIVLVALGWGAVQCRGQEAKPDVAPPASWVAPIPFDARAKLEEVDPSQEIRWILTDRQINAQNNESFHHEVRQVLTVSGVNNGSHVLVNYDPGYQLLTFHWVRIWRGTSSLNRLDPKKIQVTQYGLDVDQMLFSDEKSALLMLDDVRVGDIIDFAYTVQGGNPVFAGRFSGRVEAQSSYPVDRSSTRLLWPANRLLYVKNFGTDVKYQAVRKGDSIEFTWNFSNVPGLREEPPLPVWYQPLPWVQLSEFRQWSDVNQLALQLFTNATPLSSELTQKINEWKRLPNPEARTLAALRFVQDEIRYLGIESGISGFMPSPPSAVFSRRYGDCKDKTLLLVTILRALGVEACPTLVNTKLRQTVFELHPSASVFDHAITQVNLEGQSYWLDATASYERGPLAVRSWPNYGYGLVVRPGATALTPIVPSPVLPLTTETQYIRIGALEQESELKVVTVAEGPDAERLRALFATSTRDEIQQANLNYRARFYSDITSTAPLIYTDDEGQNKIEVDEFYTVPKIWGHRPDDAFFHCHVYAANVETAMTTPGVSQRTVPLGVSYPAHQIFRAEVMLPLLVLAIPAEQTIENPAFYFHRIATVDGSKLTLEYEYRSLADAVFPEAVPAYVQQLDSAEEQMAYTISSD